MSSLLQSNPNHIHTLWPSFYPNSSTRFQGRHQHAKYRCHSLGHKKQTYLAMCNKIHVQSNRCYKSLVSRATYWAQWRRLFWKLTSLTSIAWKPRKASTNSWGSVTTSCIWAFWNLMCTVQGVWLVCPSRSSWALSWPEYKNSKTCDTQWFGHSHWRNNLLHHHSSL